MYCSSLVDGGREGELEDMAGDIGEGKAALGGLSERRDTFHEKRRTGAIA